MSHKLHGLYVITDEILTPDDRVVDRVAEALEAGADVVQYRNKHDSDEDVEQVCRHLQTLCSAAKVPFIIDDRPYLAEKIGADGLHIGKDDMPIEAARAIFKEGIIGVSCYGSVRKAQEAEDAGADYVAFGSFFPSPTKPHSGIVNANVIAKAKAVLTIPVCAIGGINITNIHEIAALGPEMICVVSAAFEGDIAKNIKQLKQGMNV